MHEVDEACLEHRLSVVVCLSDEALEAPGVSVMDEAPCTPVDPGRLLPLRGAEGGAPARIVEPFAHGQEGKRGGAQGKTRRVFFEQARHRPRQARRGWGRGGGCGLVGGAGAFAGGLTAVAGRVREQAAARTPVGWRQRGRQSGRG